MRHGRADMRRLGRRAFTLVELLVVIGIIALLIGILLPSLNKARQQASALACLANMRQLGVMTNLYAGTAKGSLPFALFNTTLDGSPVVQTWGALLATTLKIGNGVADGSTADDYKGRGVFLCKGASIVNRGTTASNHYSCHPLLMPNISLTYPAGHPLAGKVRVPYKLARIKRSAEIVQLFDGTQDLSGTSVNGSANSDGFNLDANRFKAAAPQTYLLSSFNPAADLSVSIDAGLNVDSVNAASDPNLTIGNIRFRHLGNKSANVLFCDGHAAPFVYKGRFTTDLARRNIHLDSLP